jgi:hypothetical protein
MLECFPNKWSSCTYEAKMTNSKDKGTNTKGWIIFFVEDQTKRSLLEMFLYMSLCIDFFLYKGLELAKDYSFSREGICYNFALFVS